MNLFYRIRHIERRLSSLSVRTGVVDSGSLICCLVQNKLRGMTMRKQHVGAVPKCADTFCFRGRRRPTCGLLRFHWISAVLPSRMRPRTRRRGRESSRISEAAGQPTVSRTCRLTFYLDRLP
jgi:hypothetical protein